MNTLFGQEKLPLIIIHGGASPIDPKGDALIEALDSIQNMADVCMKDLSNGASAIKIVVKCLEMLENDEKFNAGIVSEFRENTISKEIHAIVEQTRKVKSRKLDNSELLNIYNEFEAQHALSACDIV